MANSHRVPDYLGYGLAADRPDAADFIAGVLAFYYSTDTKTWQVHNGTDWVGVTNARVAAITGATHTVLGVDDGLYRPLTYAGPKTITVGPESGDAKPDSFEESFDNTTSGDATFVAGSGVTITPSTGGTLVVPQDGVVLLKRLSSNTYRLVGTTVPA